MSHQLSRVTGITLLLVLLVACATPVAAPTTIPVTPTVSPIPPTDTPEPPSCDKVEGNCLWLSFDGEICTYEGPTSLKAGHVTLLFLNESESFAAVQLARHTGDTTIQDTIDYIGEEPSTVHHPSWTKEINGVWKLVYAKESHTWEGDLESGVHTMACARISPYGVWFAGGFTVED